MAAFPRWRGLNHFNQVMEISFTDGSKYEDISKVLFIEIDLMKMLINKNR
jgi:hypothetical protein